MMQWLNTVQEGDCLQMMRYMPDESVDLVVTSPPYNLRNTTGGGIGRERDKKWQNATGQQGLSHGYAGHDDKMPHAQYVEWQRACLTEMMRLIPDHGAIFYNHKWRVQGGLMQDRSDIMEGFPVRQIIIWQRSGGINHNDRYFLPTYEVVYLVAKPDFILRPKASGYGDVWRISQDRGVPHPAPFPVELPRRIISSTYARVVLDPFMGSGQTGIAAVLEDRDYIGMDLSPEYCATARERIALVRPAQLL